MIQRVYLDLDRTLLDTERLVKDLFGVCEELYGLPADQLVAEAPRFYFAMGNLRHYDLFAQLEIHGIAEKQAQHDLFERVHTTDYLFAGASELLDFLTTQPHLELRILTFGKPDYQQFKRRLLPRIRHIPASIIFQDKAAWLSREATIESLLVDDKPTWPLPPWCIQLLFEPTAKQLITQENPQMYHINSLKAVETFLTVGYNGPNQ